VAFPSRFSQAEQSCPQAAGHLAATAHSAMFLGPSFVLGPEWQHSSFVVLDSTHKMICSWAWLTWCWFFVFLILPPHSAGRGWAWLSDSYGHVASVKSWQFAVLWSITPTSEKSWWKMTLKKRKHIPKVGIWGWSTCKVKPLKVAQGTNDLGEHVLSP
jgi:hypothetical protein